jgi:hypothetical protein
LIDLKPERGSSSKATNHMQPSFAVPQSPSSLQRHNVFPRIRFSLLQSRIAGNHIMTGTTHFPLLLIRSIYRTRENVERNELALITRSDDHARIVITMENVPTCQSAFLFRGRPRLAVAATRIDRRSGKSFIGSALRDASVSSADECENACRGEAKCVGYTFLKSHKQCKLFARIERFASDNGASSGVKTQSAP